MIKDSIRAALAQANADDWIIFIDDHAASGTQVRRRLRQWLVGEAYTKTDSQLEPIYRDAIRRAKLAFAFAAMTEEGAKSIRETTNELSLDLKAICSGAAFDEFSLRDFANSLPELRAFLSIVGTGLMLPRFRGRNKSFRSQVNEARTFSLGYRNAEGGLVTELNVPASTYTAFWRPGFYDPTGKYAREGNCNFPWMPLFIRSSHIDEVTLF